MLVVCVLLKGIPRGSLVGTLNNIRITSHLYINFQAGVTIVDSPGIGESEELKEMLVDYMHKSFGFIYVINSTNAGGVQADRVCTR